MQNQGDSDVARAFLGIEQEVRMQVNLAVIFNIKTGARFKVGQMVRIGQLHIKETSDPGANLRRRRDQIDPDRLQTLQVIRRIDANLAQATVTQLESRHRRFFITQVAVANQVFTNFIGKDFQNCFATLFANLIPDQQTVFRLKGFDNGRDFG